MKIKCNKKAVAEKVVVKKAAPCAVTCGCKRGRKPSGKKEVKFTVHAEKGKEVFVAGQFNDWNPTADKMAYKCRGGIYEATLKLLPGSYEYKFVIDGVWCADPENAESVANDQGTFNSVITVK